MFITLGTSFDGCELSRHDDEAEETASSSVIKHIGMSDEWNGLGDMATFGYICREDGNEINDYKT